MELRFKGTEKFPIVELNDVRIVFKNFEGRGDQYNADGKRNFHVVIPNEALAEELRNDKNEYGVGWNVKTKPARDDDDEDDFITLKVNVAYNKTTGRGPSIFLKTNGVMNKLTKETVGLLDHIGISHIDMDIRPYDDVAAGKPFRAAYLQSMCVTQAPLDRFEEEYENHRSRVAEEEDEY